MDTPTRVLLCDDSAVVRRLLKTALKPINEISVVAEASNGKEAVDLAQTIHPDVIVMDVEMPVMDGIDAVRLLRHLSINTPVVMFSSLTSRGAEATMDAIDAGATDFATKPSNIGHVQLALEHVRNELVPTILRWHQPVKPIPFETDFDSESLPVFHDQPVSAISIGVSTGGPQALAELFRNIPVELSVPIFIVQHMPPLFTTMLADRLKNIKGHRVSEASDGQIVQPGDVVLAPGDFHMTVEKTALELKVALNQDPCVNSCRPAVDPLFASLAEQFGANCLGIIMTGMGKDGLDGASAMKKQGARIIAQDQESSVVWGMPGVISENGLADRVLPIKELANEIIQACQTANKTAINHS